MEVQEVPCRFIEWSEKWKCFTSDSFYIDGVVNGERWKFNHYGAVVRPQFKRYINLKMGGARFIKDSCRYQNCVILGCCDEGLLFDKIGDTLHFPQLTKDFFAEFVDSKKAHDDNEQFFLSTNPSKKSYITVSGVNKDTTIVEGSFYFEFIESKTRTRKFTIEDGRFRLKSCSKYISHSDENDVREELNITN